MRLGSLSRNKAGKPPSDGERAEGLVLRSIAVEAILPGPFQPRREFDEGALNELASSIAEQGLLQPVVVRPKGERFELIVGERRVRACRSLGWTEIPAIVRELDDQPAAELALIENLQREGLNFFEEAEGYRRLIEEFGLTQEELGRRLGKGQSTIANKLRLLKFEPRVREVISREIGSERQARALLALESAEAQLKAIQEIRRRGLNATQTESLVKRRAEKEAAGAPRRQRVKAVYKDIRLFMNSLQALVAHLERSGVSVEVEESQAADAVEVRIRVLHGQNGAGQGLRASGGTRRR